MKQYPNNVPDILEKYEITDNFGFIDIGDDWKLVEIYRIMHNGHLPPEDEKHTYLYVLDFLDLQKENKFLDWQKEIINKNGDLFTTAKRFIYTFVQEILHEINTISSEQKHVEYIPMPMVVWPREIGNLKIKKRTIIEGLERKGWFKELKEKIAIGDIEDDDPDHRIYDIAVAINNIIIELNKL